MSTVTLNVEDNVQLAIRLQTAISQAKEARLIEYGDSHDQMGRTAKALLELAEAQTRQAIAQLEVGASK